MVEKKYNRSAQYCKWHLKLLNVLKVKVGTSIEYLKYFYLCIRLVNIFKINYNETP